MGVKQSNLYGENMKKTGKDLCIEVVELIMRGIDEEKCRKILFSAIAVWGTEQKQVKRTVFGKTYSSQKLAAEAHNIAPQYIISFKKRNGLSTFAEALEAIVISSLKFKKAPYTPAPFISPLTKHLHDQ